MADSAADTEQIHAELPHDVHMLRIEPAGSTGEQTAFPRSLDDPRNSFRRQ